MRTYSLVKQRAFFRGTKSVKRRALDFNRTLHSTLHAQRVLDSGIHILLIGLIFFIPLLDKAMPQFQRLVIQLGALSVFSLCCLKGISKGRLRFQNKAVSLIGLAFVISCFVSAVNAAYIHDGLAVFNLIFVAFLVFLVVLNFERLNINTIVWSLIAISLIEAVYGLYQFSFQNMERVSGTFFNPNYYGSFLAIPASVLISVLIFGGDDTSSRLARSNTFLKVLIKFGWILAVLTLLISIVLGESRSVILATVFALCFLLSFKGRRWLYGFLIAGTIFLTVVPNPFTHRLVNLSTEDPYAYSRLQIWKSTYSMIREQPIFGIGLGMYSRYSQKYAFPSDKIWVHYDRQAEMAHSEFFQVASELGVVGLLLLMCGLGLIGRKIFIDLRSKNWIQTKGLHLGLIAGLLIIAIQSMVDSNLHNPAILLIAVTILGFLMRDSNTQNSPVVRDKISSLKRRYLVYLTLWFLVVGVYFYLPYAAYSNYKHGIKRKKSVSEFKKAALLNPLSADYQQCLAGVYYKKFKDTNDYSSLIESLNYLKNAITLDKRNWIYHKELGDVYIQLSRNDKLLSGLNNPDDLRFNSNAGYSDTKRLEEQYNLTKLALKSYQTAIELKPYYPMLRLGLGTIYYRLDDYDKAMDQIRMAVELEPYFLRARYYLGKLTQEKGKLDMALNEYNEMIKIKNMNIAPASRYQEELLNFDFTELKKELERLHAGSNHTDRIKAILAELKIS